eukprot:TRINITY_DN1488_c0_g2_i1.p1 TRINITY_DN1488_c0_g2~~TRINITY_DN1488_c0_g2_i1.p1  ORF type:complete len:528 (-),score=110.06 TRINITY_DN1488_c0_g2_i1:130-1509(-)
MGQGKSSLLNLLGRFQRFREGNGFRGVTNQIETISSPFEFCYGRCLQTGKEVVIEGQIHLSDTPGIGEPDQMAELKNLRDFSGFLSQRPQMTMILITIKKCRVTSAFVQMFRYFQKLLQHFMKQENWAIVLTQIQRRELEGQTESEYLAKVKISLEERFGFKIPHIFCFWARKAEGTPPNAEEVTRQQIFTTMFMKKDQSMEEMRYPLPPTLERLRLDVRRTTDLLFVQTSTVISYLAREVSERNRILIQTQEEAQRISSEIDDLQRERKTLEKLKQVLHPITGGDCTILNGFTDEIHEAFLEYSEVVILPEVWNCLVSVHFQDNRLTARVEPNFWTWTPHPSGKNWCYKINVFVQGTVQNAKRLSEIRQQLQVLEERKEAAISRIRMILQEMDTLLTREYHSLYEQYRKVLYVLSKVCKSFFSSEELPSYFQILEQLIVHDQQILNLDYSQFEDFETR